MDSATVCFIRIALADLAMIVPAASVWPNDDQVVRDGKVLIALVHETCRPTTAAV